MASTYKVLGQVAPAAATLTTLYTVPTLTSAVCSTLSICNLGVSTQVKVAVRPAGATIANEHYVAYDVPINQYESVFLTLGVTLAATDVISVYAATADVSFGLFGTEVS